jgi:excisionase family DNA binding protein
METAKKFLNKLELAVELGISIATVNRRLADGSIPFRKIGSRILIPRQFVDELATVQNGKA